MVKIKSQLMNIFIIFCISLVVISSFVLLGRNGKIETFEINYYAVVNGKTQNVPTVCVKVGGQYPTEYVSGAKDVTIDDLCKIVCIDSNSDYMFTGWFLDESCTKAFDGVIEKNTTGDITLFARLSYAKWSDSY